MNATKLAEYLQKMAKEYQTEADDTENDRYSRMFDAGVSKTCEIINKELLEAIEKGDIR